MEFDPNKLGIDIVLDTVSEYYSTNAIKVHVRLLYDGVEIDQSSSITYIPSS